MRDTPSLEGRQARHERLAERLHRIAGNEEELAYLDRQLGRARFEMGEQGSNDGEHDVLHELTDLLRPEDSRR